MRMDRYEDLVCENNLKQTRTNKNQELYTDVYLNNVYVNIDDLKDVVKTSEDEKLEEVKVAKEEMINNYTYEEKAYDINILLEEAIKNKKEDNLKRSLDKRIDDLDLKSLIESINENHKQKESIKETLENEQNDNLLTDLLPENNDTLTIEPLAEPVLDRDDLNTLALKEKNILAEELNDKLKEEKDESFFIENEKSHKTLWIIIGVLLLTLIITLVVLWKFGVLKLN